MRYIDRFLLLNKLYIPPFISQFVSPNECPAPRRDRRHGGAPADQDPAHHEEHLSPAVHVHVLVGVSRAPVLHGVIPALPGTEHGLLPQDDEDGPGEGEAQGPPAPVRADVDGEGGEEHHEGQRELGLPLHVTGVQVLLDEDPGVDSLCESLTA